MQKYYYTYKVTLTEGNLKDKVYFGKRITDNIEEGYIGSGKILLDYLKKYPDGYRREILNYYNSKDELARAEYELIHPHLGKDYCINLKEGGEGGCSYIVTEETREKMRDGHKRNNVWLGKHHTKETRKKQSDARKKFIKEHPESAYVSDSFKYAVKGKHRVYNSDGTYHYEK